MAFADIMPVVSVTAIVEVTTLLDFVHLLLQAILNSSNIFEIGLKVCGECDLVRSGTHD